MYIQSSLRLEGGIEKKELVVTALSVTSETTSSSYPVGCELDITSPPILAGPHVCGHVDPAADHVVQ